MNVLYLAHRIPYPPDKGDKLRAFREIERLSKRHRVWCACFVDAPSDLRHVAGLREFCEEVAAVELTPIYAKARGLWALILGGTVTEGFYQSREMYDVLRRWTRAVRFDAVVAYSSSMATYALHVPAPRRVLDLCDCDSQKWLDYADRARGVVRRAFRTEGARLAARELRWIDAFDAAILITETEAAPLREFVASRKLHIIGNGVALSPLPSPPTVRRAGSSQRIDLHPEGVSDSSRGWSEAEPPDLAPNHPPSPGRGDRTPRCLRSDRSKPPIPQDLERYRICHNGCVESVTTDTVGFIGVLNYLPNVDAVSWFARECWPMIRSAHHSAVFRIVGRSPVRSVRKLGRLPGVQVIGGVDDVAAELRRFDVSVAPLRIARGIQNKVLEAMAAAKPVVLTSKAAAGIAAENGRDYLVQDSPEGLVGIVRDLLGDPSARQRIGDAARRFVARHHRWDEHMDAFEMLVTGALERTMAAKTNRQEIREPIPVLNELPADPQDEQVTGQALTARSHPSV